MKEIIGISRRLKDLMIVLVIFHLKRVVAMSNKNNIILIVLLFLSIGSNRESTHDKGSCSKETANKLVLKYFSNFDFMEVLDMDAYVLKYFKSQYPQYSPSYTCADFDGNDLKDYAFLLADKNKRNSQFIFVIIFQVKYNKYKIKFKFESTRHGSGMYIIPRNPGELISQTEAINVPKNEVKLKYSAVE